MLYIMSMCVQKRVKRGVYRVSSSGEPPQREHIY